MVQWYVVALDINEKLATISRYNERLNVYGYDPRTLGWFKGRQDVRFKILSEIGDLDHCSILDVGCGFGDLYGFLVKKGLNVEYTGIDINPNLIEIAKKVYPDANFKVMDLEEEEIDDSYDWAFESGVFNFKIADNLAFIKNTIGHMFSICKKGVAADFMSSYVDFTDKKLFYASPEDIFTFGKTLSRRVALRCDYMPFEFCMYVYKNDAFNERVVFKEYDEGLKHNKYI